MTRDTEHTIRRMLGIADKPDQELSPELIAKIDFYDTTMARVTKQTGMRFENLAIIFCTLKLPATVEKKPEPEGAKVG